MTTTQIQQFTVRRSTSDHNSAAVLPLPPTGHFINGSFVPGSSSQSIDVVDPSTEQVIASVQAGTADDVDAAVVPPSSPKSPGVPPRRRNAQTS
jgi:aminobutyraldehyde dehydrogenase